MDRHEEKDGYGVDSSTRGGSERGGYGDDQGTRVGQPDAPRRGTEDAAREARPSTHAVDEGLEGSVLSASGNPGESRSGESGSTGAGSEASEGIHGAQRQRDPSDRSSVESAETGRGAEGDVERAGSEPMRERSAEHESGYGGRGGEPKDPA